MTSDRASEFQRNPDLELLLDEINDALGRAESSLELPARPIQPTVFIVGPPRSGTTLLMQWIAASGGFCWPTNLLSRFYGAPYLGSRIQQILTDPCYNYRDELLADSGVDSFSSQLGKTKGLLQPNEFWYFWRRFFPVIDPAPLSQKQSEQVDGRGFIRGIAAIQHAFGKPFAAKALLLQFNIALLGSLLPNSLFLCVRRSPVANAVSIRRARQAFWGDESRWYSVRPPGHEALLDRSLYEQIAGQILLTNQSLSDQLLHLPDERKLFVSYEEFCEDPDACWTQLIERLRTLGATTLPNRHGDSRIFEPTRSELSNGEERMWNEAYGTVSRMFKVA